MMLKSNMASKLKVDAYYEVKKKKTETASWGQIKTIVFKKSDKIYSIPKKQKNKKTKKNQLIYIVLLRVAMIIEPF